MKRKKILITIVAYLLLGMVFTTNIFAAVNINNIDGKDKNVSGGDAISKVGSYIYSGITNVAIVLAVVVIAVIGIKYMLGSADERAEYKKSLIPYLVGALLVFGASIIAKAVVGMAG